MPAALTVDEVAGVEEDARRAVELRDDHALGAVDDEGAVVGHDRDLPEVDLLLLHVADRLRALRVVPGDQADRHLERRRVGHAALQALLHVVLRLLERVADELERGGVVEVLDREDRVEDGLQAGVLALLRLDARLQEALEGLLLDLDQVRDLEDLRDLREILPDAGGVLGELDLGHGAAGPPLVSDCDDTRGAPALRAAPVRSSDSLQPARRAGADSHYLMSTWPPAASICSLIFSASSLDTPSLTVLGAPSTRSLASLRPRPVIARTSLMTWIFLSPGREQDDVELGLLLGGGGGAAAGRHRGHGDRRRGGDAPLLLEQLGELGGLHHREGGERVGDCVEIGHVQPSV